MTLRTGIEEEDRSRLRLSYSPSTQTGSRYHPELPYRTPLYSSVSSQSLCGSIFHKEPLATSTQSYPRNQPCKSTAEHRPGLLPLLRLAKKNLGQSNFLISNNQKASLPQVSRRVSRGLGTSCVEGCVALASSSYHRCTLGIPRAPDTCESCKLTKFPPAHYEWGLSSVRH